MTATAFAPETTDPPVARPSMTDHRALRSGAGWLTLAALVVGALNYAYSLSLTWILPVASYAVFATAQALLLVAGTAATASVPWVLSQEISRSGGEPATRRDAVSFSVVVGTVQGVIAGIATGLVTLHIGSPRIAAVVGVCTLLIFVMSVTVGYVQGFERFRLLGGMRIIEVVLKVGLGLLLVVTGSGVWGSLAGFGLGSGVVLAIGTTVMARDLVRITLRPLWNRRLWRNAFGLLGIQGAVALMTSLDVILASLIQKGGSGLSSYQVSMVLSRVPLFLSVAVSMAVFPRISRGSGSNRLAVRSAIDVYLSLVIPLSVATATIPNALVGLAFPAQYSLVGWLLTFTAPAGALLGAVNLITTFFQAESRFRRCTAIVSVGLLAHGGCIVAGHLLWGTRGIAIGALVGAALVVSALLVETERTWRGSVRLGPATMLSAAPCMLLLLLGGHPVVWSLTAASCLAWAAWRTFLRRDVTPDAGTPSGGLRVLHLAYEDHRRPGSGGGAVRTHEINRRLALRHQVTVVAAKYPGCRDRVEDNVRYTHVGLPVGRFVSILAYFAALPLALRRHRSDLVVEDFGAPFSSVAVPLWTRRPVVGVVQWLFAREKSRQYRLPFFLVERAGVRSHRRMIAVSADLAHELRRLNPSAEIDVIANGVSPEALRARGDLERRNILFLGRVEVAQKGLDMLLRAYAAAAPRIGADLVIAGDGPDTEVVGRLATELGIASRVHLVGRVTGAAKYDLLASALLVCMPSRYETFGMVAIEALACHTPVVAFDIPCLREVVPSSCGILIPPFDEQALADALVDALDHPALLRRMGDQGAGLATRFDWDVLASLQEAVYHQAAGTVPSAVRLEGASL